MILKHASAEWLVLYQKGSKVIYPLTILLFSNTLSSVRADYQEFLVIRENEILMSAITALIRYFSVRDCEPCKRPPCMTLYQDGTLFYGIFAVKHKVYIWACFVIDHKREQKEPRGDSYSPQEPIFIVLNNY